MQWKHIGPRVRVFLVFRHRAVYKLSSVLVYLGLLIYLQHPYSWNFVRPRLYSCPATAIPLDVAGPDLTGGRPGALGPMGPPLNPALR